jgi:hypothetical protein
MYIIYLDTCLLTFYFYTSLLTMPFRDDTPFKSVPIPKFNSAGWGWITEGPFFRGSPIEAELQKLAANNGVPQSESSSTSPFRISHPLKQWKSLPHLPIEIWLKIDAFAVTRDDPVRLKATSTPDSLPRAADAESILAAMPLSMSSDPRIRSLIHKETELLYFRRNIFRITEHAAMRVWVECGQFSLFQAEVRSIHMVWKRHSDWVTYVPAPSSQLTMDVSRLFLQNLPNLEYFELEEELCCASARCILQGEKSVERTLRWMKDAVESHEGRKTRKGCQFLINSPVDSGQIYTLRENGWISAEPAWTDFKKHVRRVKRAPFRFVSGTKNVDELLFKFVGQHVMAIPSKEKKMKDVLEEIKGMEIIAPPS